MNHHMITRNKAQIVFIKNVEIGTAGKIVGLKKPADMGTQVTAATRDKYSHLLISDAVTSVACERGVAAVRASEFSFISDSGLPMAISISPLSMTDSPLGLKISRPSLRRILTITISRSERMFVSTSLRPRSE